MRYGITEILDSNVTLTKRKFCIKKNHWFYPWAYALCKTEWVNPLRARAIPYYKMGYLKVTKLSANRLDFISKDWRYHYEELCKECLKKLPRKLNNKIKYNFIVAKLKS